MTDVMERAPGKRKREDRLPREPLNPGQYQLTRMLLPSSGTQTSFDNNRSACAGGLKAAPAN
jgi:hypothetical protein